MIDRFGRKINYLRISVTDKCNLRCGYCMPPEGINLLRREDILSFEEIVEVTRAAVDMGVTKVRLTGGEPLVRRGIVSLVDKISDIEGIDDFAMTTNAVLLAEYADALAGAGLDRINISLDTTDAECLNRLTGGGDIHCVFAGIEAAVKVGLLPIKLNCVVSEFTTESDVESVKRFGREHGFEVRLIHRMDFSTGCFHIVEGGSGGDCQRCNRLRLTSVGMVCPCLFSDISFDVRELGPVEAIRRALADKPKAGGPCTRNWMGSIGG